VLAVLPIGRVVQQGDYGKKQLKATEQVHQKLRVGSQKQNETARGEERRSARTLSDAFGESKDDASRDDLREGAAPLSGQHACQAKSKDFAGPPGDEKLSLSGPAKPLSLPNGRSLIRTQPNAA
jgi:hypothetical protein